VKLAIACDHRGYEAKRKLLPILKKLGHEVRDFGCDSPSAVDYPVLAALAGGAVARGEAEVAILLDGSGVGMSVAANKVDGIRAALIHDDVTAKRSREHNHCNALCVGCDLLSEDQIRTITEAFLNAAYGDGRHARRVEMVNELEKTRGKSASL
jgi:ribose 5-phosphate isomerase B